MKNFDDFEKKVEQEFSELEESIVVENKTLDEVMKEQLHLDFKWNRIYSEVIWYYENAKTETETVFSEAFVKAISDPYKDVSTTEAKYIASTDKRYVAAKKFENRIFKLKKQIEGIVDLIESRKYILKDMTSSIINQVNKYVL